MKSKCYLLVFFAVLSLKSFATHIVGGEIYYNFLGGTSYSITLKLYRDCYTGLAPYDDPATIFIFDNAGNYIDSIEIAFPGSIILPSNFNNPCFISPTNICVEEAIYITTVNLPPISGGYNIVYQRCCRNNSIQNIISPGTVGSTYMTHIPDASIGANNSSPHYINFPPIFICLGAPLSFNHGAFETDGDSLYYELCDPYTGLDESCPILGFQAAVGCPPIASAPPYPFIPWLSPYNAAYPISSSPAISINAQNGSITGTPDMLGQWVLGVCVSEFRNGALLTINKRDFQFNVIECQNLPVASIPLQNLFCSGYTVNFSQNSLNAYSYHWDFGDPSINTDTSNILAPNWTYADSGSYSVQLIINPGTLCADTFSNTFYVYPLLAPLFTAPPGECINNNSFNFNGGGTYLGNGTINWEFGLAATPSNSNQINPSNIVFNSAGTYLVKFTVSENGCTQSITDSVTVYPKPNAAFGLSSLSGCTLNPFQIIDSSYSLLPINYFWDFDNGTTSIIQNPIAYYSNIGDYTIKLIITNEYGCSDTSSLQNPLTITKSPIAGFELSPTIATMANPEIEIIDKSVFADSCQVFWGDGTSSSNCDNTHHYSTMGTYTVIQVVKNINGCYDTAYNEIFITSDYYFWIPNAFTPNKNELNDLFKPKTRGVENYLFIIFDRWGEKIFETSDFNNGWDGSYMGKLCKSDVYVYKITFDDLMEKRSHQFIGNVTLIR